MGTRKVEQGQTGERVAAQVRALREGKGWSLRDLSERMALLGRPIITSGLSKIESGDRRVDVDDLVALAAALGTTPGTLLGGDSATVSAMKRHAERVVQAANEISHWEEEGHSPADILAWLEGDEQLPDDSVWKLFPSWMRDDVRHLLHDAITTAGKSDDGDN